MGEGNGLSKRSLVDRSEDWPEDAQSGGDPAHRPDDRELPGRSGREGLAADGLQPTHADALYPALGILLQHDTHTARTGGDIHRWRSGDLRARPSAEQRWQFWQA